MTLRRAGACKVCARTLDAGVTAFWDVDARTVTCSDHACADADGLLSWRAPTGPWEGPADMRIAELREFRLGGGAPVSHRIVLNSGAVLSVNARGRCEDAPCCGCCS